MSAELIPPVLARDGERAFEPNNWAQQEVFWDEHPEALYSGALGSSKTRTACEKLDYRCRMFPGAVVGLVRRYRTDLGRTSLQTLFRDVITPSEKLWGWRASNDGGSTLFYPNGSRMLAVGCDSLGPIRGTEFDMLAVDQAEEMDEELWVELLSRCRHRHGPYQGLYGFCNPDSPAHFLYRRFRIDLGNDVIVRTPESMDLPNGAHVPKGYELRRLIVASPGDNAENLTTTNLVTLATMTGVQAQRLREGKWVMPFGLVYPEFNAATHVIEAPPSWARWGGYPPPDWTRICGVDFGYRNAFAFLWIAIDPDDRLFVYRELYCAQRSVPSLTSEFIIPAFREELAKARQGVASLQDEADRTAMARFVERPNVQALYCDHDRGAASILDEMLEVHRLPHTTPANKDIVDGINRVRRRLIGDKVGPAIFFVRDMQVLDDDLIEKDQPRSTLGEFPLYQYPKRPRIETSSDERLDLPIDRWNHGLAAVRYAVASYETEGRIAVY